MNKQSLSVAMIAVLVLGFGICLGQLTKTTETTYIIKYVDVPQPYQKSTMISPDSSGEFKSYMDYRTITDRNSKQWALQQLAKTDDEGFRTFQNRYIIAIGTAYSKQIGKKLDITLDDSKVIRCIVGDIKSNVHTNSNNTYDLANKSVIEFLIDEDIMQDNVLSLGDVSSLNLQGKITKIEEVTEWQQN